MPSILLALQPYFVGELIVSPRAKTAVSQIQLLSDPLRDTKAVEVFSLGKTQIVVFPVQFPEQRQSVFLGISISASGTNS